LIHVRRHYHISMNSLKNLLCILSLSDTDRYTIKYTAHLAKLADTENIYINFINEHQDLPDYLKNAYPSSIHHDNQTIVNKLREDISTVFISDIKANVVYNVFEKGNITDNCLQFILEHGIDLVVYKKNTGLRESISLAKKLARRATCSTLLLTENYISFSKMLIPSDFSSQSKEALETAIQFAQFAKIQRISLLHIIEWSSRDIIESHDPRKFIELIKSNAALELDAQLDAVEKKEIEIDRLLDVDDNIEMGIQKVCRDKKIDLVVIAARGTSSGVSIFLGSVAEKLIEVLNVPILVVRKKGTGTSILKSLFKMF